MKEYTIIKTNADGSFGEVLLVSRDKNEAFMTAYKAIGKNPKCPYEKFYESVEKITSYCVPLYFKCIDYSDTEIHLLTKEV